MDSRAVCWAYPKADAAIPRSTRFPSLHTPIGLAYPHGELIRCRDLTAIKDDTLEPCDIVPCRARYPSPLAVLKVSGGIGRACRSNDYVTTFDRVIRREPRCSRRQAVVGVVATS